MHSRSVFSPKLGDRCPVMIPGYANFLLTFVSAIVKVNFLLNFINAIVKVSIFFCCFRPGDQPAGRQLTPNGELLQFATAQKLSDGSYKVANNESTMATIRTWRSCCQEKQKRLRRKEQPSISAEVHVDQLSENVCKDTGAKGLAQPKSILANYGSAHEGAQEGNIRQRKAEFLSRDVQPPPECCGSKVGDAEVVLLCGEIPIIKTWLVEEGVVGVEELGKLDTRRGNSGLAIDDEDDSEVSSCIFCLLPRFDHSLSKLYFILRVQHTDSERLQEYILRMALDLSPSWLIFYSRQNIEDNGFVRQILPSSLYSTRECACPGTEAPLLHRLRQAFKHLPCRPNPEKELPVLHLHYVFSVSLDYFINAMCHDGDISLGGFRYRPVCAAVTENMFSLKPIKVKDVVDRARCELPIVHVGVSLLQQLAAPSVTGHTVNLDMWLPKFSGFIPFPVIEAEGVDASASLSPHGPVPGVVCGPPRPLLARRQSLMATTAGPVDGLISNSLCNLLGTWKGQVQVLTAIGADDADATQLLDRISGSSITTWMALTWPRSSRQHLTAQTSKPPRKTPRKPSMYLPRRVSPTPFKSSGVHDSLSGELSGESTPGDSGLDKPSDDDDLILLAEDQIGPRKSAQLIICCRPSSTVLYVVMAIKGCKLADAKPLVSPQGRAVLISAAALADFFFVPMEHIKLEPGLSLLKELGQEMQTFRRNLPRMVAGQLPTNWFQGTIVPTLELQPELDHAVRSRRKNRIFADFWSHWEALHKAGKDMHDILCHFNMSELFLAMQPIIGSHPTGHIRKLVANHHRNYSSGLAFLRALETVQAALTTERLDD